MRPTPTLHHSLWSTVAAVLLLSLSACSTPRRGPAVPLELQEQAQVLGMPAARSWGDTMSPEFTAEILAAGGHELDARKREGLSGPLPPAEYLVISGGGANGAFGAGLLCGWTAAGNRPEFKVVTGISTGALTAPFAFLGPAWDAQLKEVYTTLRTKDIAKERGVIYAALFDDALADTKPLQKLLVKYITPEMLDAIAAQYARGRFLLIATTNLDAQRAVIWNVGAIASSHDPRAPDLVRKILLASAAIPAAFPPVLIDVEVDGKKFQEMHVDGGAAAQLFLYPASFELRAEGAKSGFDRDRRAYIIRNARLDPGWAAVQRQTLSIASRAIESLIQTQGEGDLYRVYATSLRDGVDFNLAFIPAGFSVKPTEAFDPVYMSKLFEVGFAAARGGYPWSKGPPGFALEAPPAKP